MIKIQIRGLVYGLGNVSQGCVAPCGERTYMYEGYEDIPGDEFEKSFTKYCRETVVGLNNNKYNGFYFYNPYVEVGFCANYEDEELIKEHTKRYAGHYGGLDETDLPRLVHDIKYALNPVFSRIK